MPGEPTDSLAHDLRAAGPAAADRVDREFRDRLGRLADALLDGRVRGRLDPEDVVQSVFKSFVRRQAADPFPVADRFELWHLLATIARRIRLFDKGAPAIELDPRVNLRPKGPIWMWPALRQDVVLCA